MDALNQAKNLIEKSRNILVLPFQNDKLPAVRDQIGDAFCASLALFYTLKKLQKKTNFLIEKVPEKFSFLVLPNENFFKKFIICVNTDGKKISEMYYEKNEKDLKIHLLLDGGDLREKDISFDNCQPENFLNLKSDLLITIGAENLQDLGSFFQKSPQFFYETPILNIDNHPSNENFGQVNLVDIVTPSCSEIVASLIKSIDQNLLEKEISTSLLAGIISASQNFQNSQIRPKTFEIASLLLEKGADHQKIIKSLYKTKSVSQMKLLGRVLEKLNFDEKRNFHFCSLTKTDFTQTQTSPKDLSFVIEELKFNFWRLPALLILWESASSKLLTKGVFYSSKPQQILKILENFEGISKGEGVLFLIPSTDLNLAKEKVLKILNH